MIAGFSRPRRARSFSDQAAGILRQPYDQRAREGAAAYRPLADLCAQRAAIHAGATIFHRARSFAALVSARGYGAGPRRFGARALAMDVVVGLSGLSPQEGACESVAVDAATL